MVEKQAIEEGKLIKPNFTPTDYATYIRLTEAPVIFSIEEFEYVLKNNSTSIRANIVLALVISTFAGNGYAGRGDSTGIQSSFYKPQGMVSDSFGNVYVADTENNLIRKISPLGVVTTYAGNGVANYVEGAASSASFNSPQGIVVDSLGNIYVADTGNNVIRKITPGGQVSTIAGSGSAAFADGTGTSASFNGPTP
jgi:streptogramin lyase